MSRLKGRLAVVTDAASGMGRGAACRLDNKGANSEVENTGEKVSRFSIGISSV